MEIAMLECYLFADNRRRADSGSSTGDDIDPSTGDCHRRTKRFRREVRIPARLNNAPVLWEANVESDGKGMLVTDDRCYIGTTDGRVIEFDHNGTVLRHMRLEGIVSSLIKDGEFVYAWCHARTGLESWKGALYDITDSVPWLMYDVVNRADWITHATVVDSCLAVADNRGLVSLMTLGEVVSWSHEADGSGNFFDGDSSGIYAAHKRTICRYGLHSGEIIWTYTMEEGRHISVRTGVMDDSHLYVDISGRIVQLCKDNGGVLREFCPSNHRAGGLCVGSLFLITGTSPTAIFDLQTGSELYRMNFPGRLDNSVSRMVQSGKMFTFWDRLYCVDLTNRAVLKAVEGASFRSKTINVRPETAVDCAEGAEGGSQVILEVADEDQDTETTVAQEDELENKENHQHQQQHQEDKQESQEGTKDEIGSEKEKQQEYILEPRDKDGVISYYCSSADCHVMWRVAMPPHLMSTGRRFVTNRLVPSKLGSFYRIAGGVRMLTDDKSQ